MLCLRGRKAAGLRLPERARGARRGAGRCSDVHTRTGNGIYTSPDEVVGSAMHALEFAENDPEGKRRLLRYALALGVADSEAGRLIPAEVVFARRRDRARRRAAGDGEA